MRGAAATGAADAFDMAFARDFASSVPGRPFTGSGEECEMLTLRVTPQGETELVRVRYSLAGDGVAREMWRGGAVRDENATPDERDDYATMSFRNFAYAGTNSAEAVWTDKWEDDTPKFVSLECSIAEPPARRIYVRRADGTAPR